MENKLAEKNTPNEIHSHKLLIDENIKLKQIIEEYEKEIQTSNKKLAEIAISNQRKLEFICHLSHEFKTPLNAINGFALLILENTKDKDKQTIYCKKILKAAEHMYQLLDSSIEMAKAETDKLPINYQKFNTSEVILEVMYVLNEKLKEKEITIKTELDNITIVADKRRFKQIIYNLLGNAHKFNKKGGHINIKTKRKDKLLYCEIEDTGCGIKNKDQPNIFEFFSCFNNHTNKESTGIGLSLCKKIINMHGGEIDFISIPNKGSKFWFYIPINNTKKSS